MATTQKATHRLEGDIEERRGLLDEEQHDKLVLGDNARPSWSTRKVAIAGASFILLLIGGAFARILLMSPSHPDIHYHGDIVRSNGTHDFRRTVLMVSIDGLRCVVVELTITLRN